MSDEEILKKIKESDYQFLVTKKDEQGTPYLQHVFRLYQKFFGEVCSGCPTKIAGYILKLKKLDKMEEKIQSKFKLKKGALLIVPGTNKAYSNHNLTDEIALDILKENPNRRALFIEVPKDLDKQLKADEEAKAKEKAEQEAEKKRIQEEADTKLKADEEAKAKEKKTSETKK